MSDTFWEDLNKDLEDPEFRQVFEETLKELKSNLIPTGKVIILKDNERVIDKWTLRLLYALVFFTLLSGVLRLINWWLS